MNNILPLLPAAKRWALILGIFWSIVTVLSGIGLLFGIIGLFSGGRPLAALFSLAALTLNFIIPLCFTIFLFKYQGALGRIIIAENPADLITAAINQKRYVIINGVLSLIYFIFFLIGIFGALALPAYQNYIMRVRGY